MITVTLFLKRKLLNLFSILLIACLLLPSYNSFAITSSSTSCGQGLKLDGINDWVNIPDYTLTNDFTLEGWFKLDAGIDYRDVLFGQEGSGPDIHFTQGKVRLYAYGIRVTAKTPLVANIWGHIAITRSDGILKVYINGVVDPVKGRWRGALSIKAIGRGNRGYFKGGMDEIRIWNVARTEAEISTSFDSDINPNSAGLIGYWNFNDIDQVIIDTSHSANNAFLGVNAEAGTDDPVRLSSLAPISENCDEGGTGENFNEAPVAFDDIVGPVVAGGTLNFSVTGNDEDIDGNLDATSVEIISIPSDGTALVDEFGVISYFNTGAIALTDTLGYTVTDTEGLISNEATVTIEVTEPTLFNENPIAQADTAIIQSGDNVTINVLANDSDNDGYLDKAHLAIISEPDYGTVVIDYDTGEITYTHDGSVTTSDNFIYTIADDQGAVSNEAIVSITITNSSASCGKGLDFDGIDDWVNIPDLTLANDFTIEGWFKLAPGIDYKDVLFGQEGSGPDIHFTQGRVRLYSYGIRVTASTPLIANIWGHIAITRSGDNLKVYINGVEDPVIGRWKGILNLKAIGRGNRGYFQGMMDEIRIWNIVRTDDEINASYNTIIDPNVSGLIGYWNFNALEQVVTDASNASNHGSLGINTIVGLDDPVILNSIAPFAENCDDNETEGDTNVAPIAINDTVGPVEAGQTISFLVTGNDVDSDNNLNPASVTIVSVPSNGTAMVNTSGTITYYNTGAAATIDTFTYTVADTKGLISNEATVSINVTMPPIINTAPIANDDTVGPLEVGESISFTVTGNDTDSDDNLNLASVNIVSLPSSGTATVNTAGTITYLNTGSTALVDSLKYTVADTKGLVSNEATVLITVTKPAINSAPIAHDDTVGPIDAGKTITFSVTENDLDSDSNLNPFSVVIKNAPTDGIATVNVTGTITYLNTGDTAVVDTLSYTVADSNGVVSNEATVIITVTEPTFNNILPIAHADTAIVLSGGTVTINVLNNDSDSDGTLDKSTLVIVNQPYAGIVDIDTVTGNIIYTHDESATSSDSFSYTVKDDQGALSNEASVSITINSVSNCGRGIELDGINDWVNIPDLALADDFTVEGWVKLAAGIDNKDALFGQEGGGSDINFYQGKVHLYNDGDKVIAKTALLADTWAHIAITRSNDNLTLYINGVEDATGIWNGTLSLKAIGRGNRGFLKGMIDEIRVWNIARTATEIFTHYDMDVDPNSLGLIGYWTFNENDQIITDISSSANHGSLGRNTIIGVDDPLLFNSTAPFSESCDGGDLNVAPIANNDAVGPVQAGDTISFIVTGNDLDSNGNLNPSSVVIVSDPAEGTATVDAFGAITYTNSGTTATTDTLSYTVADTEGAISNIATVEFTIVQSTDSGEDQFSDTVNTPPSLINPTKIILSKNSTTINIKQYGDCGIGKVYSLHLADNEDALITFEGNNSLPYPVHIQGGKNVIIKGLDISLETQPGNEVGAITLSSSENNQSNSKPLVPACAALRLNVKKNATHWVEGAHIDTNGHDADAIIINADENSLTTKVVVQNSLIEGIESNSVYQGEVSQTQNVQLKDLILENVTIKQAAEGVIISYPVNNVELRNINYDTDLRFDSDDEWDNLVIGEFFDGTQVNTFSLDNIYIKYKNLTNDFGFIIGDKHFTSPETAGEVVNDVTTESHPEVHFLQIPPQGDFVLESQVGKNY